MKEFRYSYLVNILSINFSNSKTNAKSRTAKIIDINRCIAIFILFDVPGISSPCLILL